MHAQTIDPEEIVAPVSLRVAAAREQLGAMFAAGELSPLPRATQTQLRGLELFLLDIAADALSLESEIALARFAPPRRRWLLFGRR